MKSCSRTAVHSQQAVVHECAQEKAIQATWEVAIFPLIVVLFSLTRCFTAMALCALVAVESMDEPKAGVAARHRRFSFPSARAKRQRLNVCVVPVWQRRGSPFVVFFFFYNRRSLNREAAGTRRQAVIW
jgi:hypothetical protein